MPQGLQIYDGSGRLTVDVSTHLQRYLGMLSVTSKKGAIINDGLTQGVLWFCFTSISSPDYGDDGFVVPKIWSEGNTLHWEFSGKAYPTSFIYGVF